MNENAEQENTHAPKQLSAAENAILTVKVLAGFGGLGAILWAVSAWVSAR
jgi:hypothetical protein